MADSREDSAPAPGLTYSFRRSVAAQVEDFSLTSNALVTKAGSVPFTDIAMVRVYSVPGMRMAYVKVTDDVRRCTIRSRSGQKVELVSQHFIGLGKSEDRSAAFNQFVSALVTQVSRANPSALLLSGMPPLLWWIWFITFAGLVVGIVLVIILAAIGLIAENQLTLKTAAFLLVLAAMLFGPMTFLVAVWRRRTRPLHPWMG
jgi:hypothetical protein